MPDGLESISSRELNKGDDMAKKKKPARKSNSKPATRKRPTARKQATKPAARKRPTARNQATKPAKAKVFQQCGQACPLNLGSDGSHHGACSLDVGHTSSHKCSVDGFEWS